MAMIVRLVLSDSEVTFLEERKNTTFRRLIYSVLFIYKVEACCFSALNIFPVIRQVLAP